MKNYTTHFNTRSTPQSQPIPGREADMKANHGGGFSFVVDDMTRLDRFLILGSSSPTFYQTARELTLENAACIERLIKAGHGRQVVARIVKISDAGRAPKNDPAIFALAICAQLGDVQTKVDAREAISKVCRTGTHLFHFAQAVDALGGWGRGIRTAIARWYTEMPVKNLAMQAVKYQQRDGWSHRDVLRKVHPKTQDPVRNGLFSFMTNGKVKIDTSDFLNPAYADLKIIDGFALAKEAETAKQIVKLVTDYGLPREAIPTQFLNDIEVWEALLPHMGLTALIRNLGKMTSVGLIAPLSAATKLVVSKLSDGEVLRRSRIHPLNVLIALKTYALGHGVKSGLHWTPESNITRALDAAFYETFSNVTPTGKNFLLGVDVSGSMGSPVFGTVLSCREAAAAMAMVITKVEPWCAVYAFDTTFKKLNIEGRSLEDVTRIMNEWNGGGTDCSLPMVHAKQKNLEVDVFTVTTDIETWAGRIQPSQALFDYRRHSNRPAKLAVFGMAATDVSIADPNDAGMMDFVGFDSGAVSVFEDFCRDGGRTSDRADESFED